MSTLLAPDTPRALPAPRRPRPRRWLFLGQVGVGVVLVGVWWLAAAFAWLPPELLPSPAQVARAAGDLGGTGGFWLNVLDTLVRALISLAAAIVVGVPVGLVLGLVPAAERATRFVVDFARSFPVIAMLPVVILVAGADSQSEIFVVFLGVIWPVLLQTVYGARHLDPVVRDTARSYRISLWLRFTKVLLPTAAPFIMTGIRIGATVSFLVAVGVELLARTGGMGGALYDAQVDARPDLAYVYIIAAGLIGMALNWLLQRAERRLIVWNARAEREGIR